MTKEDIIKDCEKMIKEVKLNNSQEQLKIKFISIDDNDFTKKKQLIIKDKNNRIIITKNYFDGPADFELKYKDNKFISK